MRILLTNDDGIHAPGILALYDALTDASGRFGGPLAVPRDTATRAPRQAVFLVAPLTSQSASSHGVTFHQPIPAMPVMIRGRIPAVAVDARPADCVKLALSSLWPERFGEGSRPDLVISGINAGANCGINVIYSGTVAAALEAAFLGVPAIAFSLHLGRGTPRFDIAAAHARLVLDRLLAHGLPRPHECLNVNIPVTEAGSAEGRLPPVRVCPMNTHGLIDVYQRVAGDRPGGDGAVEPGDAVPVLYQPAGDGLDFRATEPGSDVDLLRAGCITVTPLGYDLTQHGSLARWRDRLEAIAAP